LSPSRPRGRRRWFPADLPATWLYAYATVWIVTLVSAAVVVIAGPPLIVPVRHVLGLTLSAHRNPHPNIGRILASVAHNTPIVGWPLLLGIMGAHRHPTARYGADGVLLACVLLNTLQVGAALGAYGTALLAYIPNVPFEWAGLALGASAWLLQRRRALTVGQGFALLALIVGVLLCAATLETVGVPHR
jgi:hypothetical protein